MESMKLSGEQIQECRAAFALFDKDGDGIISGAEIKAVMKSLGQEPSDKEVNDMINEVDGDHNGTIDFDEFLVMMTEQLNGGTQTDEELQLAFNTFDKDGNGQIDAGELFRTMKALGEEVTMEQAEQMVAEADVDGDGKIDLDEFKKMLKVMDNGAK